MGCIPILTGTPLESMGVCFGSLGRDTGKFPFSSVVIFGKGALEHYPPQNLAQTRGASHPTCHDARSGCGEGGFNIFRKNGLVLLPLAGPSPRRTRLVGRETRTERENKMPKHRKYKIPPNHQTDAIRRYTCVSMHQFEASHKRKHRHAHEMTSQKKKKTPTSPTTTKRRVRTYGGIHAISTLSGKCTVRSTSWTGQQ